MKKLPPHIQQVARLCLGPRVVTIQQQVGRGAWVVGKGSYQADYIPLAELPEKVDPVHLASLLQAVEAADLTRQAVMLLTLSNNRQVFVVLDAI